MPTYDFRNTKTGEEFESRMSISERSAYLEQNPHIIQIHKEAPPLGDPVRLGITRKDAGMKEVLQKIKSKHRGSTIDA